MEPNNSVNRCRGLSNGGPCGGAATPAAPCATFHCRPFYCRPFHWRVGSAWHGHRRRNHGTRIGVHDLPNYAIHAVKHGGNDQRGDPQHGGMDQSKHGQHQDQHPLPGGERCLQPPAAQIAKHCSERRQTGSSRARGSKAGLANTGIAAAPGTPTAGRFGSGTPRGEPASATDGAGKRHRAIPAQQRLGRPRQERHQFGDRMQPGLGIFQQRRAIAVR